MRTRNPHALNDDTRDRLFVIMARLAGSPKLERFLAMWSNGWSEDEIARRTESSLQAVRSLGQRLRRLTGLTRERWVLLGYILGYVAQIQDYADRASDRERAARDLFG